MPNRNPKRGIYLLAVDRSASNKEPKFYIGKASDLNARRRASLKAFHEKRIMAENRRLAGEDHYAD